MELLDYVRSLIGEYGIEKNGSWWFHSPWRSDTTPSFSVKGDRWRDFGDTSMSKSEDLIALVMKVENCSYRNAVNRIGNAPIRVEKKIDKSETRVADWLIYPITHSKLIDYARQRGVSQDVLVRYCVELHEYKTIGGQKKHYFYLAFKNSKGGYAIRSVISAIKGNRGQTSYSFLEGENKACVLVFEGMFDFLSYYSQKCLKTSVIVLNSVTNTSEAIPILKKFFDVHLFLDNDKAGDDATRLIISQIPTAIDHRNVYSEYNDVNDYIVHTRM